MKRAHKRKETRWQQAHPKAGATYSPRSLFRGLKVPYSNVPGRKRIHLSGNPKTKIRNIVGNAAFGPKNKEMS